MSTPQQITQGDSMPTSLYQLEAAIVELFALRDEAEHEEDSHSVAVIDQEIQKWVAAELRKVDGVVSFIRETDARADIAEAEAKRLTDRAKVWRAKGQRVKDAALRAMQDHGITKPLHGNSSTLRIQANGGQQGLDADVTILSDDLVLVDVRMTRQEAKEFLDALTNEGWDACPIFVPALRSGKPDTDAIRAILKQRVKCPECSGAGDRCPSGPSDAPMETCPRCKGSGTIPNSVPGARLVPRGEHLRIG